MKKIIIGLLVALSLVACNDEVTKKKQATEPVIEPTEPPIDPPEPPPELTELEEAQLIVDSFTKPEVKTYKPEETTIEFLNVVLEENSLGAGPNLLFSDNPSKEFYYESSLSVEQREAYALVKEEAERVELLSQYDQGLISEDFYNSRLVLVDLSYPDRLWDQSYRSGPINDGVYSLVSITVTIQIDPDALAQARIDRTMQKEVTVVTYKEICTVYLLPAECGRDVLELNAAFALGNTEDDSLLLKVSDRVEDLIIEEGL